VPGHLIHVGFPKAGSTALGAWFESRPELEYAPNALAGHYHAFELAAAAATADLPLWHVTSAESFSAPRVTDDPLAGAAPHEAAVAELLDYDVVVAMYEQAFGAANVIVLPYELLRDDPAAFVAELETRLGLPAGGALVPRRNVSLPPGALVWQRRLSILVGGAARLLPARLGARLFRGYVALTRGDRLRRPLELVERVVPGSRDPQLDVPAELIERLRGRAASLAGRPFYDRYASDYLNA
jgi:hypothetical protein